MPMAASASAARASADERAAARYEGGAVNGEDRIVRKLAFELGNNIDTAPETYTDELVEGVLLLNSLAVLYGDSNSGKTFFAIDIAAAVAEGCRWQRRNVAGGVVVYLASEAPGSVRMRVKAHRCRFGRKLSRLAVVKSPINLFQANADVNAVVALVRELESLFGDKVVLIIGDTLARLAAGANENSSEMGVVMDNADAIRGATGACFLLIHHTGKDAAKGMRGWSGVRAIIDTEIEVTEDGSSGIRTAETTKQRDLPKGERMGFRLDVEIVGRNQWGALRTTCVVLPADAPAKPATGKPLSEAAGAIREYLAAIGAGCARSALVKHFDGRYDRSTVYRNVSALVKAGIAHDVAGIVALTGIQVAQA
jgi:hypothetical protein